MMGWSANSNKSSKKTYPRRPRNSTLHTTLHTTLTMSSAPTSSPTSPPTLQTTTTTTTTISPTSPHPPPPSSTTSPAPPSSSLTNPSTPPPSTNPISTSPPPPPPPPPHQQSLLPLWRLHLCTLSYAGIQVAYSAQANLGTSELLRLGIHPSHVSLAWLAGPLSGLFMQPIVGHLTDVLRARRPFIFAGAVFTSVSLVWLSLTTRPLTGVLAFFALDLSLQIVQAPVRALVTDGVPVRQRAAAASGLAAASAGGMLINGLLASIDWTDVVKSLDVRQPVVVLAVSAILVTVLVIPCAILAPNMSELSINGDGGATDEEVGTKKHKLEHDMENDVVMHDEDDNNNNHDNDSDDSNNNEHAPSSNDNKSRRPLMSTTKRKRRRVTPHSKTSFTLPYWLVAPPRPFWHAFLVQLCTWSGFFAMMVYANAWVGTYIFLGDGSAIPDSTPRLNFDAGIRLGSLGTALGALITFVISSFMSRTTYSLQSLYLLSQLVETFTLCTPKFLSFIGSRSKTAAFLNIALFGVTQAVTNVIPWLLVAHALQISSFTKRRVGFYTTVFNVSQSLPQLIIGLAAPLILSVGNGDVANVMAIAGCIAALGAVLVVVLDVDRLPSGVRVIVRKQRTEDL